jgi:hypothetical protein
MARKKLGPMQGYVIAIVIDELSLTNLARWIRCNRQEVAGVLKLGLDTLADHYGIDQR